MPCSAIVINYFCAEDTAGAVRSLLADESNLNVVVVDNSCNAVESAALIAALPSTVRVLVSSENLGFGRACNWAARECESEFLFLVNPDARVLPGCIALLTEQFRESDSLGAVAPMQYLDDACTWMLPPNWFPTEIRAWAIEVAIRSRNAARKLSQAAHREAVRFWSTSSPITQRSLSGGMMMIRRSAVDASEPLFDPRFFMYFEDSDFCRRLKRRGFTFAMVPSAKGIHRWRNHSHKDKLMAESAVLYFDKYAKTNTTWRIKSAKQQMKQAINPLLEDLVPFPLNGLDLPPGKWLFELSLTPLMCPAIARIVEGSHVCYPNDVLGNFEGAPLFARVGPLSLSSGEDNHKYFNFN